MNNILNEKKKQTYVLIDERALTNTSPFTMT